MGGGQSSVQLTAPGSSIIGGGQLNSSSRLWGADVSLSRNVIRNGNFSATLLGGFRYLDLNETLDFSTINAAPGVLALGIRDYYSTQNHFYGGQIGGRFEWTRGRFFVTNTTKVAVGNTHEVVTINGISTSTPAGFGTIFFPGGGFNAIPPALGRVTQDEFTVVPEVQLNLGLQVTSSLRAYVGYTFLYWSNVARPGNQVDTTFDPATPPKAPVNPANKSDYWRRASTAAWSFGTNQVSRDAKSAKRSTVRSSMESHPAGLRSASKTSRRG